MSKEAMQAIAIYKGATAGALNCLLWMAIYSRDEVAPFRSIISQRTLANLTNMTIDGVRKALDQLRASRVLSSEPSGRTNLYTIHLTDPDPAEYGALFAPPQHRYPSTDISTPVPQYHNQDMTPVPQYHGTETTVVPQSEQHRYPSISTPVPQSFSTYMRKNEKEEEKERAQTRVRDPLTENEGNGEAETEETLPPPPPLPDPVIWVGQPATFIWQATLAYLHEHPDIDGWEVTEDDLNVWAKHVTARLPSPARIMFQAKSELLTPAFRGVTTAAIAHLSDNRFRTEYRRP